MSLGREYIADREYERDCGKSVIEKLSIVAMMNAAHGIWHGKDGKVYSVDEMTTSHIKNSINMLKRNNSPFLKYYEPMFEKELQRRSEHNEL